MFLTHVYYVRTCRVHGDGEDPGVDGGPGGDPVRAEAGDDPVLGVHIELVHLGPLSVVVAVEVDVAADLEIVGGVRETRLLDLVRVALVPQPLGVNDPALADGGSCEQKKEDGV